MLTPEQQEIVLQYLGLARHIAKRFRNNSLLEYDDLLGEAKLALVEAVVHYPNSASYKNGYAFGAYAKKFVYHRLCRALRKALPVHVPERQAQRLLDLKEARQRRNERIIALGWTEERIDKMRQVARVLKRPKSLDAPISTDEGDGDTFGSFIRDWDTDVETLVTEQVDREWEVARVKKDLARLSRLMRVAVSLRFGVLLPGADKASFQDVLQVAGHIRYGGTCAVKRVRTLAGMDAKGGGFDFTERKIGQGAEAQAPERRAEALWRRVTSGRERIPALCVK